MKVAVVGAEGVLGQEIVSAMGRAGHRVSALARKVDDVPLLEGYGARAVVTDVFSQSDLERALRGHDVVVNAARSIPVGVNAMRPSAWMEDDRLHGEASPLIAAAAKAAGVGRLIQESLSSLYPDRGAEWIGEDAPFTSSSRVFNPRLAEIRAAVDFARGGRTCVILRLGQLYGRDERSVHGLQQVRRGRPVLLGRPKDYLPLIHHRDAGAAFVAALDAGTGFYNVCAEPVTRGRWAKDLAAEAGADEPAKFYPTIAQLSVGPRLDVQRRSQRLSPLKFAHATGWRPTVGPATPGWSKM
ncbi:NAD-dependent epimerase/dehydratase family protein [Dermabacteraceae bacterium P13264]|nr:NAD(P)-dependent oxidoreductase [Dermabacteraceae bacterium TAE3-ERU5]